MKTEKKIKILQISHGLAPGGIEAFLLNVFENIDREKFEVDFAVAADGKQFHEDRILNQGAKVYHTSDLNGIKNILKHFFRLIKVLKNEGPFDVVHSHIDFMNGINLMAAYIARVPLRISHAHGTNSSGGSNIKPSVFVRFYRIIMRIIIITFSNKYIGCSTDANLFMYGEKNKNKTIFMPNGVDFNKFKNNKILDNKKQTIKFITIGRFVAAKNGYYLAKVLNEFRKINSDFHLNWIGVGPLESKIKDYINSNNLNENVSFLGNRNDISELFNKSDLMLFPSLWEGLPVTLVEAQASGTPCFISENISAEANLGLCTTISINQSPVEYAKELYNHIKDMTYNKEIDNEKSSNFNIKNVVHKLEKIYTNKKI